MTRKDEIEICVDKLKEYIDYNTHQLKKAKIVSEKGSNSLKYWVGIVDRDLKEIIKYIEEHDSI